ncbi:MAG: flippase [Crocinitomicaceae bacterium]|nr:flippase [Crocinitomicaceae bacterium]
MIRKIKNLANTDVKKKFISNFFSLSILQGVNLILPLITFPYLVRILGIEKYGLVVFAQAFITYFTLIADYGFNLSGVREISFYKNNSLKITRIYNSILIARLSLVLIGFVVLAFVVFSFDKFSSDWRLYFLTYGLVIGNALFPTWFFQGMEKMKYITILSVIAKTIFTIFIFVLVKNPDDFLWVPMLNSLGYLVIGFISLIIINRQFNIPFKIQKKKYIKQQLQKGWFIFISKVSTNLYTATTTFVLGLVTNTIMVGYYAVGEKVIRIIVSLFSPFTQVIYPHVVQLVKKSSEEAELFLGKVIKYTLLVSLFILMISVLFSYPIFQLIFQDNIDQSVLIFRILSPLIVIIPLASVLFNIVLLAFKMDNYFFKIYLIGALVNIALLAILLFAFKFSIVGAAMSLLISESVITGLAIRDLKKKNIKIFSIIKQTILSK